MWKLLGMEKLCSVMDALKYKTGGKEEINNAKKNSRKIPLKRLYLDTA